MDKETVPNLIFVNVRWDGQVKIAQNVSVYQDVFMDFVKYLLNANVKTDGTECFVTSVSISVPGENLVNCFIF